MVCLLVRFLAVLVSIWAPFWLPLSHHGRYNLVPSPGPLLAQHVSKWCPMASHGSILIAFGTIFSHFWCLLVPILVTSGHILVTFCLQFPRFLRASKEFWSECSRAPNFTHFVFFDRFGLHLGSLLAPFEPPWPLQWAPCALPWANLPPQLIPHLGPAGFPKGLQ